MDNYLTPSFIIPALIAASFAVWYFFIRKRTKSETVKVAGANNPVLKDSGPVNVMLYDRTTFPFTRYESTLDDEVKKAMLAKHGTLGRELIFGVKKLIPYFKGYLQDKVVYEPIFEPMGVDDSPKELYIDTRHYYAEVTEKVKTQKGFMEKNGALLIWLFGLAVIAFLIIKG
jgi:hypothetical protein